LKGSPKGEEGLQKLEVRKELLYKKRVILRKNRGTHNSEEEVRGKNEWRVQGGKRGK